MKLKVYLNDDTYIEFVMKDDGFALADNYKQYERFVKVKGDGSLFEFYFNHKKIAVFNSGERRLYRATVISDAELKSISEYIRTGDPAFLNNIARFARVNESSKVLRTDLHTHFMELLSGPQFLHLILKYVDGVKVDQDYKIIIDPKAPGNLLSREELLENEPLFNMIASQLSLDKFKQNSFPDLSAALKLRNVLVDSAGRNTVSLKGGNPDDSNLVAEAKGYIYVDYLIEATKILKAKGIKYLELSYANQATIKRIIKIIKEQNVRFEGIDFRFLLAANRRAGSASFNTSIKDLDKLLHAGLVKGFDLMGEEIAFSANDVENVSDPASFISRITRLLPILNKYDRSVLRLHAGENMESKTNPLISLLVIDRVAENAKLTLPPPYIRLGHGVYFDHSDLYVDLLRKYQVIIELNASSNFALSNVKDMREIPYEWYRKRGIPCVLGTDGGGMYYTDPRQEKVVAQAFGGDLMVEHVRDTEDEFLREQGESSLGSVRM